MQTDPASCSSALQFLMRELSIKDSCTGDHVLRVAHYAMRIAEHLPEFGPAERECLRLAATLHDIGKIGIDDRILKKTSALSSLEWESMRRHPDLGREILENNPSLSDLPEFVKIAEGVRLHHERWDGAGYPEGLSGEQIPRTARIIAVADAFDAMVSTRPYRQAMSPNEAFAEISVGSGTQFDPTIVAAFERAFSSDLTLCAITVQTADSDV